MSDRFGKTISHRRMMVKSQTPKSSTKNHVTFLNMMQDHAENRLILGGAFERSFGPRARGGKNATDDKRWQSSVNLDG